MAKYVTDFASIDGYEPGSITVIDDDKKHYVFSNMFDVAARSDPYERVAIAKNFEYVLEVARAEGASPWYAAAHDEFVLAMDGPVEVRLAKLADGDIALEADDQGARRLAAAPTGPKMGHVKLTRGHMALLPVGAAYQFVAPQAATVLIQTIDGPETVQKWADICQQ